MGKGTDQAKNSGTTASPHSPTATASPKEEKRHLGVISSLSQRTNRYIPGSPTHTRNKRSKNFLDGPQQQSSSAYELHKKPRSFINLGGHHSVTPPIPGRSNRSQTLDEHALNPSSPRDRIDLHSCLDTDLITTKPYQSATPKLRRRAGSHASEIEGTVASLDVAVSIHRPQQHVPTSPLRIPRKNKSPLGSYNPSQVIRQLNHKLAKAERENGNARQVEAIGNQIVEERRELMKIFKQLKAQEQKHHDLLKEDDQIQEIISKTKVKELQHHIPRQALERIESEIFLATISGPNLNETVRSYKNYMSAISTSTYPVLKGAGRAGDPICDFYYSRIFEQGTIFALSDGCNWGKESQQAAQRAATCFVKYIQDRLYRLTDTRKVTREILSAFAAAHEAIMEGKDQSEFFRIGTATLVGGALLPLLQQSDQKSPQKPLAAASLFSSPKLGEPVKPPSPPLLMQTPRISELPKPILTPSEVFDGPKRPQRKRSKRKSSPRRHSQRALGASPLKHSTSASDQPDEPEPTLDLEPTPFIIEASVPVPETLGKEEVSPREKNETSTSSPRKRKGHKSSKSISERTFKSRSHNRHRSITHYGMYNISMDQGRQEEFSGEEEEIDQKQDWSFIFGSVGDCKVFLYNPASASVTDITSPNRTQSLNASDCGGRLGPCDKEGRPDLRNLFVVSATVRHGDIILVMSDGIHDNLDPELLGKFPSDLDDTIDEGVLWKDLAVRDAARLKTVFQENTLAELIHQSDQSSRSICDTLVEYSRRVTLPSRSFMEQNPSQELPDDYTLYPGKMDHTSCLCITVSRRNNASDIKLVRDAFVRKDTLSITHSHMS